MNVMQLVPRRIKDMLKRSEAILKLHRKMNWQLYLFKDWWGTQVWKKTTEVMTPLGFKLVSGFHPAYTLMRKGTFEIHETAIMKRLLDNVDVLVDVGANLGYYTCLASLYGKHVIAIEPQQQNVECLTLNLMVNGYQDQVEIFPLALSNKPGLLALYGASGPSASLIRGWAGYSPRYKQLVPVSTLDNVLGVRFSDKQLCIKLDVEGAEFQVLQGAHSTLCRAHKPCWLVEICLREFHPSGGNPDFKRIFDLFWSMGYQAYTATDPPRLVTESDIDAWIKDDSSGYVSHNYVFLSKEMALASFPKPSCNGIATC